MLIIEAAPVTVAPSEPYSKGSSFEGYEYFEAASIRKVKEKYYFIYSSIHQHELCYAVSDNPITGFEYGGVLISNNDMYINTYKPADRPMFYGGNNHGSIVEIKGQWYVFYHRHTNGTNYSRQGCIEPIHFSEDGSIRQAEMTSCGPNGGPLRGKGEYPAYLACNLLCNTEAVYTAPPGEWMDGCFPKITQDGRDGDELLGYIDNMQPGATAGFKYFDCKGIHRVGVRTRGRSWGGSFAVKTSWDGESLGEIAIGYSNEWKTHFADISIPDGVNALYFTYLGPGNCSLAAFILD